MKIFSNLAAITLQCFGTAGSCVTAAGGSAARQNHANRSRQDERAEDIERRCAAMGSGGEMVGSRAVEANQTGRPRIRPHEARDRGQVPIVSHRRELARCPQTRSTWRGVRGPGDCGVLTSWLPATSPSRPHVAASSYGWSIRKGPTCNDFKSPLGKFPSHLPVVIASQRLRNFRSRRSESDSRKSPAPQIRAAIESTVAKQQSSVGYGWMTASQSR